MFDPRPDSWFDPDEEDPEYCDMNHTYPGQHTYVGCLDSESSEWVVACRHCGQELERSPGTTEPEWKETE